MASKILTAKTWEAAWESYVDALGPWEHSYPLRYSAGHKRKHKANRNALSHAKTVLRKMDPEFCSRMGI